MAASSSTPYNSDQMIDPDDVADLDDLDDPLQPASDRAPLTGNIQSRSSSSRNTQSYLTSAISGEDRRAPTNTIDESVWETLSRDLKAVWEKIRLVLWPKYLLGGILTRRGEGIGGEAERGEATAARGVLGRWPDADAVLQSNMSDGLRDWDLWGPLLFSLLLSLLISRGAKDDQGPAVFSGVFALVWAGKSIVTLQIKLLGGNVSFFQALCIIGYTLFPLVIASLLSAFNLYWVIRLPIYLVLIAWALAAGVSILGGSGVLKNRVGLAVYPLFVFYIGLGALCFVA